MSETSEPVYYKVKKDGNTTACLATGFSSYNQTLSPIFDKTKPVRDVKSSLSLTYSELAMIEAGEEKQCEETTSESKCSGGAPDPDPKVNFMSLMMLGLRLLFLKTIVFNVLMTTRFLIS